MTRGGTTADVLAVDLGKTGCRVALWASGGRTDAEGIGAPGLAVSGGAALAEAAILAYLVAIASIGLRLSGRQASATAYFVGERDLPWWAVCFSIVATETSTLTVISVPGVAYMGAFGFVSWPSAT